MTLPGSISTPQALNSVGSWSWSGCGGMPGIVGWLLVEVGVGVDERDQLAAAQHELVERVLGSASRQVARMDHQQDLDVLVDLLRAASALP